MPSVPLMSARPSFSRSSTGARSRRGQRLGGRHQRPVGVAHRALAHQRQRAVRERREIARAAERAVLVDDRRDAVGQQVGHQLGGLATDAGVAGRQRREPQQHQAASHLALDLGAGAGRVRADQRALQLGALLDRDVPGGERTEPGRDAVRRRRRGGELLHHRASPVDRGEGLVGEPDRRSVTRDPDHVLERDGSGAEVDGLHGSIQDPGGSPPLPSATIGVSDTRLSLRWAGEPGPRRRAHVAGPAVPGQPAAPGPAGAHRAGGRPAAQHGVPPAERDDRARLRGPPGRGADLRAGSRGVRGGQRLLAPGAPPADRPPAARGARRAHGPERAPRGAARPRRPLRPRGAGTPPTVARHRRRRPAARTPHRERPRASWPRCRPARSGRSIPTAGRSSTGTAPDRCHPPPSGPSSPRPASAGTRPRTAR